MVHLQELQGEHPHWANQHLTLIQSSHGCKSPKVNSPTAVFRRFFPHPALGVTEAAGPLPGWSRRRRGHTLDWWPVRRGDAQKDKQHLKVTLTPAACSDFTIRLTRITLDCGWRRWEKNPEDTEIDQTPHRKSPELDGSVGRGSS